MMKDEKENTKQNIITKRQIKKAPNGLALYEKYLSVSGSNFDVVCREFDKRWDKE